MKIDFSTLPLVPHAFSETPMTFCSTEHKRILSSIMDIILVETGDRVARENWQAAQLSNLLAHAAQKSRFWHQRVGRAKNYAKVKLASLPVLTRSELRQQVAHEGCLLPPSEPAHKHITSGSSGAPAEFFNSRMNGFYNSIRGLAQYLMDGRDLSRNILRLKSTFVDDPRGFSIHKSRTADGLSDFLLRGAFKQISYTLPNLELLRQELRRDSAGHMIAQPRILETLLQFTDPGFFKEIGVETWISVGERPYPSVRAALLEVGIPVTANYSCEEFGMIAHECATTPDFYHVATSNVIVEIDQSGSVQIEIGETPAGRVLVTHLHSYATPFIRYDIGDIASLRQSCPCGFDGPVLTNIYGRAKQLLTHPDGRLSPFLIPTADLVAVADISEFRIRQTARGTLVLDIATPNILPPAKMESFRRIVQRYAGEGFDVIVNQAVNIDWGNDTKRLGFRNELLA